MKQMNSKERNSNCYSSDNEKRLSERASKKQQKQPSFHQFLKLNKKLWESGGKRRISI